MQNPSDICGAIVESVRMRLPMTGSVNVNNSDRTLYVCTGITEFEQPDTGEEVAHPYMRCTLLNIVANELEE